MKLRTKILSVLALTGALLFGGALTVSAAECTNHNYKPWIDPHWVETGTSENHQMKCVNCGYIDMDRWFVRCTYVPYKYEPVYYMNDPVKYKYNSEGHIIYRECSECGNRPINIETSAPHKFNKKTNKCICGFKRIVPGNTKVLSAKQSGKSKKKSVTIKPYWYKTYTPNSVFGYEWRYQKKRTLSSRIYTIKFKLKKAKNVEYYIVSDKKKVTTTTNNKQYFKKNTFTYNYASKKKVKSVKLYITPVSKTGHYGKTITKTIKGLK